MWTNSIRTAVFAATLCHFLTDRALLSLSDTAQLIGGKCNANSDPNGSPLTFNFDFLVKEEWKDHLILPVEDYLHGLISVVNELVSIALSLKQPPRIDLLQSRLAVNSVTLGNFEEPIKISIFSKDLYAGFSIVIIPE